MPLATDLGDADDAIALSTAYGLVPDDWQEHVIEGWMGRRPNGKWASPRCGLAVPRQNGKNGTLEIRELAGMVLLGERILHTAHEVKTARKAFARLLSFFDNERQFPELFSLVREIRRTNGQEAIFLTNGGSVEFIARSKGSGRGFTVDVLVCDEAQELSDDALAALLPTISAAPLGNPQLILTGTPPSPSMIGEVFTRMRTAGAKGQDPRLCWHEWSSPDLDVWEANPSLGVRLDLETVEDERATMDSTTFGRERCGVWDDTHHGSPIPIAVWNDGEDADAAKAAMVAGVAAFGIEVSLDGWVSIGAASRPHDARIALELVDRQRGTGGVVARCVGLKQEGVPFVIDGRGLAAPLVPALELVGLTVVVASTADIAAAFAWLVEAAREGSIVHGPQAELASAVAGAKERPMGDGPSTFGRKKSDAEIAPLLAVMLAHWAAKSIPVRPPEVWSIREMLEEIKAERAAKRAESGEQPAEKGPIQRADGSVFTPF